MEEQGDQDQHEENEDPGPSTSSISDSDLETDKLDSSYFIGELEPDYTKFKYLQLMMKYRNQLTESPKTTVAVAGEISLVQETVTQYLYDTSQPGRKAPSTSSSSQMYAHAKYEYERIQRSFVELSDEPGPSATVDPSVISPLILSKVLDYVPVSDVLKCRTLSRIWNDYSVISLRNRHLPIKLHSASIRRITNTLHSASVIPFSSFEVQLGTCFGEHLSFDDCQEFFTEYGPNQVKSLKIYEKSVDSDVLEIPIENYIDMIRLIMCNLNSLESLTWWRIPTRMIIGASVLEKHLLEDHKALKVKTLTLHSAYDRRRGPGPVLPEDHVDFYAGLLRWMPNLKVLNLVQDPTKAAVTPRGEGFSWLYQSTPLALAINSSQIQEITTDFQFPIRFIEDLEKSLEVLRYYVYISQQYDVYPNQNFLNAQEKSLKLLQLTSSYCETRRERLYFPKLINLQSLDLIHSMWNNPSRHCTCALAPVTPRTLPKLEKLAIQLLCMLKLFMDDDEAVYASVKEITIKEDFAKERMGNNRYPFVVSQMPMLFPNLKKLKVEKICLTAATLMTIFDSFPKLEELDLFISSRFLETDVNHLLSGYISQDESSSSDDSEPICNGVSLRNLKNLTKLRLEYRLFEDWIARGGKPNPHRRTPINGFTAREVLLKMQRLQLTLVGRIQIPPAETLLLEQCHENFTLMK